ncbi:helix-turn-helix transcriptional regulator [Streptomyces sp. NPDC003077]|uniref:helix-turn-helix domain-containing protein n=1 Tax=Streptomyces sp. NPDC003077 TaxID=3154443 RepID=UPI00339E5DCF
MGQPARRTARRRRLGAALKEAREAASVTPDQAAQAIHGDKPKISRIETGRHRITRLEIDTLLNLYEVKDDKLREWLIALSAEGRKRMWWRQHSDVLQPEFKELLTLEADAKRIAAFQPQIIPGLLQTKAYAAAVIRASDVRLADDEVEFFANFRIERQAVFQKEDPPQYLCILTEGVLRQQVGGKRVMAEQLRHLVRVSRPPTTTIQVIPFEQGGYTGTNGAFVLYSYPDPLDLDVVQVEYLGGSLYLEEDRPVRKYQDAMDGLRTAALSSRQSMELISSIARDFEHE